MPAILILPRFSEIGPKWVGGLAWLPLLHGSNKTKKSGICVKVFKNGPSKICGR